MWWAGNGPAPENRYVEAGFRDGDGVIAIRRTEFESPDTAVLLQLAGRLCDLDLAPRDPVSQLCSTSIIRDEHIAGLSLRSEEHTSELQSLMRISYAVFCLKNKKTT